MLKIGELSKIKGISTKTLRHYDKIGLLRPMRVDSQTTYLLKKKKSLKKGSWY
ncbi:MerR family DNA-binding transcriptional regulator [Paenibacillus sp. DMB20]|uniref:MerR family DNA-binding transcriptional regulator n=1 Tax=Paenibacillus sp. DMB20 TaxID=1642570 RepID=UPI0009E2DE66|nr:MerR family DNA-binding transcriptional regulator [Paenibacillus sp. DMB20]